MPTRNNKTSIGLSKEVFFELNDYRTKSLDKNEFKSWDDVLAYILYKAQGLI